MSKIGMALWDLIEAPQGYAYLSDDIREMPDREAIQRAKSALEQHRLCVELIEGFLRAKGVKP